MIVVFCLTSIFTSYCTYKLIQYPSISPTRASSLTSLLALIILTLASDYVVLNVSYLAVLVFGASFVGMCSHKVVSGLEVIVASLVFVLLYIYLVPKVSAFGGALGFSAFVSVIFSRGLKWVIYDKFRLRKA